MKLRAETAAPAGPSTQGFPMLNSKLSDNKRFLDDPIVPMTKEFADARGSILPLADEEMKSAVLITSKTGSIRANHYHKTDWHYCYVLSGSIDYYFRPVGNQQTPKRVKVKLGQIFFTPPMVEHAMCFPEDTAFVCLGRNSRAQEVYEADIVRVDVVTSYTPSA
jgi:dTDP-4-dehydrorhamnose 3,5-epimerase-like enzyme